MVWPARVAARYNNGMKSLLQSNPYMVNRRLREAWLRQNALESSIFEGARGLSVHPPRSKRRVKVASKKSASKS